MQSDSKLDEVIHKTTAWLNDQVWFQELKTKWEELDPQSRTYLSFALGGGTVFAILFVFISALVNVHSLKNRLAEKNELLLKVQQAGKEISMLKALTGGAAGPSNSGKANTAINWNGHLSSKAVTLGIPQENIIIAKEKPGLDGQMTKETLIDITLNKVNIKQVVQFAYDIENDSTPIKLRNLSIQTDGNEGYLNANLAVSAFTLKN